MKIKILYEDKNLVVINKPAGINVHGDGKEKKQETIVDWFIKKYPKSKNVGENIFIDGNKENKDKKNIILKSGIVHRLDKETSGCLILCKNQETYLNLKKQFQNHTIQKKYIAICVGWPKFETGIINLPIARSKNDFRKKDVVDQFEHTRGEERDALTRYKVINKFKYKINNQIYKLSLINFYPKTGRMHQIRVHAKSIGHAILGDKLYGNIGIEKVFSKKVKRHLLEAQSIEFVNPENQEKIKVMTEISKDFTNLFQKAFAS